MTPSAGNEQAEPDDEEWRFTVEDVSEETDEDASGDGSVFGPRPDEGSRIVPGDPDPEHVLFVVLGVATTLVLMLDVVGAF